MKDNINAPDTVENALTPPAVGQEGVQTIIHTTPSLPRKKNASRTWRTGPIGNLVKGSLVAFGAVVGLAESSQARKWTDNTGKFSVEAEFVALKDDAVILRKEDGEEITVPLNRLNDNDREYAGRLAQNRGDFATGGNVKTAEEKELPKTKTWTDSRGNTIEATFVRIHGGIVIFRTKGNNIIRVPLAELHERDKLMVKQLADLNSSDRPTDHQPHDATREVPKTPSGPGLRARFGELDEKEAAMAKEKPANAEIKLLLEKLMETHRDTENKSRETRIQAIVQIGSFGETGAPALPFLRDLLLEVDAESGVMDYAQRNAAMNALQGIGKPAVPTLTAILECMKDPYHYAEEQAKLYAAAEDMYAPGKDPTGRPLALRRLANVSRGEHIASAALKTLDGMGDNADASLPTILSIALESELNFNRRVSSLDYGRGTDATSYCVQALGLANKLTVNDTDRIGNRLAEILKVSIPRARTPVTSIWKRGVQHESGPFHDPLSASQADTAIRLLHAMKHPPKEAVPDLLTAFSSPAPFFYSTRSHIIEIFGKIGPDAADVLPILRSYLDDHYLGKTAEWAIAAITAEKK